MIPLSFVLGVLGASVGGKMAVDVRAGMVVKELNPSLVILPAWGQYLKFAMKQDPRICFGGETSGHFIFKDFYLIDDGILAALRFLEQWENGACEKLEQLANKYFELPETNFPCKNEDAPNVLEKLSNFYRSKDFLVSVEDGLTVFGEDFKFNLRESLTEPLLRLNLETKNQEQAASIISDLFSFLPLRPGSGLK